jgi:3D (Asp-Asp-Asp) domain-containing protein
VRIGLMVPSLVAAVTLLVVAEPWLAQAGDASKQVNVQLANETIPLTSKAGTVGGFLDELSIELPNGLSIDPPAEALLRDGMTVNLQGMTVTRGVTERLIPMEVEFEERWRHGIEQCVVGDAGQEGLVRTTSTIFYSNGAEVGRRQREEIVHEMRPKKMICYRSLSADLDGPSVEQILEQRAAPGKWHEPPQRYKKIITMNSSAYEPGPRSCGPRATGRTSCGLQAGYGVVAVDPKFIPYGTRLFIEGYGYAVAGDTGGAIDGYDVDLGFLTVDECMQWGRKKVKAYILH